MVVKMYGLASGLDTQNLISQLLEQYRIPAYRLENDNARLQRKYDAWTAIDTALT